MAARSTVLALINADEYMVLIVGLITHDVKAFEKTSKDKTIK